MAGRLELALLAYGALNAILYATLLPLWDGFDEPFHYSFVQHLARTRELPVIGHTPISGEVQRSLELAPASHLVQRNLPFVTTFADYFHLPPEERDKRRLELTELRDPTQSLEPGGPNYEALQAPIAYGLLAPLEALWRNDPLISRVRRLRLGGALIAVLAVWLLILRIGDAIKLPEPFRLVALFLTFSSQVFYAATAHVSNDWLALSMFSAILVCAVDLANAPDRRTAVWLGLAVAAGLLTKASLLALLPLVCGLAALLVAKRRLPPSHAALVLAIALLIPAPWYLRNLRLYGNLTAQLQSAKAPTPAVLIRTAIHLPWGRSVDATATSAIWIGNNSDTTFSRKTVWLAELLIAVAAFCWLRSAVLYRPGAAETIVGAGMLCYTAGLAYSVVLNYWASEGAGIAALPWYVEAMKPAATCLLCLGLWRARAFGRAVSVLMICLWTYMIAATYVLKLIPFYSGFSGTVRAGAVWSHYSGSTWQEILADTAMGSPTTILCLTAAVVLLAVTLAVLLSRKACREKHSLAKSMRKALLSQGS